MIHFSLEIVLPWPSHWARNRTVIGSYLGAPGVNRAWAEIGPDPGWGPDPDRIQVMVRRGSTVVILGLLLVGWGYHHLLNENRLFKVVCVFSHTCLEKWHSKNKCFLYCVTQDTLFRFQLPPTPDPLECSLLCRNLYSVIAIPYQEYGP